jgi:hypothetical protein
MANRKVRLGASYRYYPVPFDTLNPPFNVQPGDIVTVIQLAGCPAPNTMGMCHVAKAGKFAGMVCTNSLQPVTRERAAQPDYRDDVEL